MSAVAKPRARSQLRSLAPIVVFDMAGPLVTYQLLRNNGHSEVTSLVLSGVFPIFGVLLTLVRQRRLDVVGALVLFGIALGTGLGLATNNAKVVLLEGTIPTTLFALAMLGSLRARRPLMFYFALESMGRDTPKGRDFAQRWHSRPGFRHSFRVMTVVWGITFLAVAAALIVAIETQSVGTAKSLNNVLPYVVIGLLVAWTIVYAKRGQRKGAQADAARAAANRR